MQSEILAGRLLPGERVIWTGRPGQGLLFTSRDIFLVPFSLVWCGFAIFWTIGATDADAPGFLDLWGAMFVLIGLYFVAGRFVADAWMRNGLHYAVTDKRILIARPAPFGRFTAVSLAALPDIDLQERASGKGTIRFGQPALLWGGRQNMGLWSPAFDAAPQFLMIENARRVFDLIQKHTVR